MLSSPLSILDKQSMDLFDDLTSASSTVSATWEHPGQALIYQKIKFGDWFDFTAEILVGAGS